MPNDLNLSNYIRIGRFDLPEPTRSTAPFNNLLAQETSGITYNPDTDTLFVVGDGGTSITQVSKTGALIDTMTLAPGSSPQGTEFYDPEGLAYIGGGKFVMVEERTRQAVEFTYAAGTTLGRAATSTVKLGTDIGNIGLEGMSFDPQTGGYIFVKEKTPLGVFQTGIDFKAGTATNGSATTVNSTNLFDPALLGLNDFADVFALSNVALLDGGAATGNLLVLSQEDGKVLEVNRAGSVISTLTIMSDAGNPLSLADQQHEGLTMDDAGNLYIVSENGGGDFDHPQMWVYAPSAAVNAAPTSVVLQNTTSKLEENSNTTARVKLADVVVADDGLGTNVLSVSGADAGAFEVAGGVLYLKAGTKLDFETQKSYAVTVAVDDTGVGATPDATVNYTLSLADIAVETPALPNVSISEVAPWSSGNSPVGADWFEVTNNSAAALDITGWAFDDSSAVFASAATLNGITSIAPGESVIFLESADPATTIASFTSTWFGANAPAGLQIGSYTGKSIGLSTGGDAVNLFDAKGAVQANISFGASPIGPFTSFNNAAAVNGAPITTASAIGVNGAFAAAASPQEIGSPGTVGKLFVSEIAPWSSTSSPVKADWFEVTNSTAFAIDLAGWKMDDSSGSPAAAVALNGVSSIAPGESVIFIESNAPAAAKAAFLDTWFGAGAPSGLQIGSYTGSGVGLSTAGDGIHLYDSGNNLRTAISFGASPQSPFATFDNTIGLSGTAAKTDKRSVAGTNKAFTAVNSSVETGSPGGQAPNYVLQILHFYGESGTLGVQTAPIMGAMIDKFRSQSTNTLTLAEGDSWIPGPWLVAGADPSLSAVPGIGATALARPDVAIMNAFGVNASALGNHEFDLGSPVVSGAIAASGKWVGAQFPFITSNLDVSADASLRGLSDASLGGTATNAFAGQEASAIKGKIAPYAVVTVNGEKIGIVGSTTFELLIKTSPNGTRPKDDANPATSDLQEVAAYLQTGVDALRGMGINKIVMVDQLDSLDRNKALAPLVSGIDVMVAGGGHERLGDANDVPGAFPGHDADFIATDSYPITVTGADGKPVLIVTTDTEYSYLGRLVVPFTATGEIDTAALNSVANGAYAANQSTLQAVYKTTDTAQQIIASSSTGKAVQAITSAIDAVIIAKDGAKFGFSSVYLEGDRVFGRAQETNLGNLSADANSHAALAALPSNTPVVVSMKNGGGLRASIGSIDANGGKIANPAPDGAAGNLSQLDIENALRFDNKLMVFDTTAQGLLNILNFAAGLSPGNGGFPQLGGLRFAYDPDFAAGQKVRSVALYDIDGGFVAQIVADGQVVAGAPAAIPVVILNFTANGGDGYPIKANGANFRYLLTDSTLSAPADEALDFTAAINVPANALGEQKAFQDFMTATHGSTATAFNRADTPAAQDLRIENLNLRADAVAAGAQQIFTVARLDAIQAEGNSGTTAFTFTVARAGDVTAAVQLSWQAAGIGGPGTIAANAEDFAGNALPAGTISFGAGQTSQTITVNIAADSRAEANERFALALGDLPSGAAVAPNGADGVILGDDTSFSIGELAAKQAEGTGSASTGFTFAIYRGGPAGTSQTVDWAVTGAGGAGALAASASDFDGAVLPTGSVTFAPDDSSKLVTVLVRADSAIEFNERFAVTLANPTGGASLGRTTAFGAILNDDGARYSIGPADSFRNEGNSGSTDFTFTVYRNGTTTGTDTLDWAVTPGGFGGTLPASAADFAGAALPTGTVTFTAAEHQKTITVAVAGDTVLEFNESFTIALSNPSQGAAIGRASSVGAILDDDTIFVLGNNDAVSGTTAANYFQIGAGNHTVTGLDGTDRFAFLRTVATQGGDAVTEITDFEPAAGEKIDLSAIDAIAATLGNDAFSFIGTAPFNGTPGQLRWEDQGPARLTQGNVTNDTTADFTVIVTTAGPVDANWFGL